ncbi:hypothetical protein Val02_47610 [Virgisporangium aliadipatigenens]|uniref:Uncharacterized protein n=1 Tax=Virgisporangium aliadipatigenens TaxID=741659 RepID=A0A8J4DR87_9ACTN|nr:DUF6069 family protein [Virgisporangium aliadipatigenens]GIJ47875.1 hypothetical protein Val02_47610 [Virgisporangium aliadipatigenens]
MTDPSPRPYTPREPLEETAFDPTAYEWRPYRPAPAPRPGLDASRLWFGAAATALVAALIAIVGALVANALFDVPVVVPTGGGTWVAARAGWYAFGAVVACLVATAVCQLLVAFAPRPLRFFTWLAVLATAVAVLVPFLADASVVAVVTTATLNLVLGIAIGSLVAGSARGALRPSRAA